MGLFDLFGKKKKEPSVKINVSIPTASDLAAQADARAQEMAKLNAECRKSEHGLTVSQILLLEYCKKGKYPNPEGGYQRFWWFEYGIKSVGNVLKQMETDGFIRIAQPTDLLSSLKTDELKSILSSLQLTTTGKKADLVERIKQNADNDQLKSMIHSDKYTLTELGERELAANAYVPYLHTHKIPELSVWDVNKNANPKHWRDYIWGKFNKCSMEYASNGQWGLYRNVRLSMAQFLSEESRYKDAFAMYGEVCFYDVNGIEHSIDYDDPSDLLYESILVSMKKLAKEAGLTEEQMREILKKRVEDCLPVKRRVPQGQMTDLILKKMDSIKA